MKSIFIGEALTALFVCVLFGLGQSLPVWIIAVVLRGKEDENKENVLIKADRNVAHREIARVIKAVSRVEGTKIFLGVMESD